MSREGKIHLVESCSYPQKLYKNVTNEASYKSLKEAAQRLHTKPRLTEATTINKMQKILKENKIDETVQKRVLEGLQEAGANIDEVELWQFPISRINTKDDPNLNGRVYGQKLWENVVDKQRDVWQGGTGLANHPKDDEDGDFMNQSIVWLDGFIGDDGFVYGIGTFVGAGGTLARQIIGVGGRVGFSTSGYGDFLADGIEVDPESYEIDRFADLVLNPSQGVFGDYSDAYSRRSQNESVSSKQNNKSGKLKENVNMKLVEASDIKAIVKAVNAENTVEELSKVADDMGLEVHLAEGVLGDVTGELTSKLLANVVKDWTIDDVTEDNISDIEDCVNLVAEKEQIDVEEFKETLKTALTEAGATEDVVAALFKEKQEESEDKTETEEESTDEDSEADEKLDEEKEACPDCGKEPCECEDEKKEECEEGDDCDEDEEVLDEDLSFEEQLIVEHYTKGLKNISKKSNELWEEKIQELDTLSQKLAETKLPAKVKAKLSEQAQKLVKAIMKDARTAIQEGFKAKKVCDELGIGSISKLSNIKEKLEDFVALEECLGKATKEANKYKALYEAKSKYAVTEAEAAFDNEEKIKVLEAKIQELNTKLAESKEALKNSKKTNLVAKLEGINSAKSIKEDKDQISKLKSRNAKLMEKVDELRTVLSESNKTISMLKNSESATRRENVELKEQLRKLRKSLTESTLQRAALTDAKDRLVQRNKALSGDLAAFKKNESARKLKTSLQEKAVRAERQSKIDEFFDSSKMFRNTKDIDTLLEATGVSNKEAFKGVKTLREAENKILFSNELLNEDADRMRDNIDVPREDVKSLSDLFAD